MPNGSVRESEKSEAMVETSDQPKASKELSPPKDLFHIEEIDAVSVESMVSMRC